ncbi:glycosyltransferase family 2 protein [bacterium]|nr:glycosyltransferase family 2 protein [candidate division CSSED10-310 bacterium]
MKLSVVIPVLNERATIGDIIQRVRAVPAVHEIVVVDDGSTDGTTEVLAGLGDSITVLRHERNRGKGAAIRTGLEAVTGDMVIIQDADLEYDPQDYMPIMATMLEKQARVVYGSRILSHSRMSYLRFWLGGRFITWCCNLLYGSSLTDEPTCYKMIEADLLRQLDLKGNGFEFCPEVTGKILRCGIPIYEVPIRYAPRTIEEGKKIRWRDGLTALWYLVKIRFSRPPCVSRSYGTAEPGR